MSGAKTEAPTAARIRRAREEGDTGASPYASRALGVLVAVALVPGAMAALGARLDGEVDAMLTRVAAGNVAQGELQLDATRLAQDTARLSLPVVAAVAVATAAAAVLQARRLGGTRRRVTGPGAILSAERLVAIARIMVGGAFVAWLAARALRSHAADVVRTSGRLGLAGAAAAAITTKLGWEIAFTGLAIATIDVLVTRTLWRRRLRMSPAEVKRERRETEGDPLVHGERERAREEEAAGGGVPDVGRARVVIWDGDGAACALRYEEAEGDRAPVVLAATRGGDAAAEREMARAMVERARAGGIAVKEDVALARTLAGSGRAGETIPEALYDAVADVMRELGSS